MCAATVRWEYEKANAVRMKTQFRATKARTEGNRAVRGTTLCVRACVSVRVCVCVCVVPLVRHAYFAKIPKP